MNDRGSPSAGGAPAALSAEYRIAHLQERLAAGELGELGVRMALHGASVLVTGTVPSAACREEVLRTVREELSGLEVHCDLAVSVASSPDDAEELP